MSNFELYNGDCLQIMNKMIENRTKVDAIICDLPYGTTKCKWDTQINLSELWDKYNKLVKHNGIVILFGTQPFTTELITSNIKNFKYEIIWDKEFGTDIYMAKKKPLSSHENILIFYGEQPTYNPQMVEAEKKNMRDRQKNYKKGCKESIYGEQKLFVPTKNEQLRYPKSIYKYSNQKAELHRTKRLHQSQKPVELLEWLIKTYTNEHEIVLDNTMGSGSTGVACANTNRQFIGIELDENYFKIAQERINASV